jgi:effector-binding domain-containing protein
MDYDYEIEVVETEAQPVLSIRMITSVNELPEEIGLAADSIVKHMNLMGEQPSDAIFVAYYNMDMDNLDVEIGFPTSKPLAGIHDIEVSEIPEGLKAICLYQGAYSEMEPVYEAMHDWLEENNFEPTGVVYEFYLNSPEDVPESDLLTKIVFLLED